MSKRSENNDNQASSDELLANGVRRRNFLKYCAGAFAAAALPEFGAACGTSSGETVGELDSLVGLSSAPMMWVTRKQDGLSLGFQFANVISQSAAIALQTKGQPGYIAITFPPQHIIEEAVQANASFSYKSPSPAAASGTSRIVFSVPPTFPLAANGSTFTSATDGGVAAFPYTLQGVLELCALLNPVVARNALTSATTMATGAATRAARVLEPIPEEDRRYETLSQARIDRVIARVDPKAAARVSRRATRAATMFKADRALLTPILGPIAAQSGNQGVAPVAPTMGETSIELPFRLLMSPSEQTTWSFMSTPVVSPATTGLDNARAELWHAQPAQKNGLTMRALWTRDSDPGITTPIGVTPAGELVSGFIPSQADREGIVQVTGNLAPSAPASLPLNVNRLMLSPLGGTIDLAAQFTTSSVNPLQSWAQKTVLGRDESVETVNVGTLLPFGQPAALVTINKRVEEPTGPGGELVGVMYETTCLVVSQPLVSYHAAPNAQDYVTFPFVAVELKKTKIAVPSSGAHAIAPGGSGFVYDTNNNLVTVAAAGTDYRGQAIDFETPLYFCSSTMAVSGAASAWESLGVQTYQMQRQRIALAPPPDDSGSSAAYAPDSTSYETVSFDISLKSPTGITATLSNMVPQATNILVAVEALRHLQSTPAGGTPQVDATYNYDPFVYAAHGFDPVQNPHGIFLTQALDASGHPVAAMPGLNFTSPPTTPTKLNPNPGPPNPNPHAASNSGGLCAPAMSANALSRGSGPMAGTTTKDSSLLAGRFDPTDYFNAPTPGGGTSNFLNSIQLFGFVPLGSIIQTVENAAAQFMPKSVTQSLSNAEAFLQKAMALYNLLSGLVGSSDPSAPPATGQWDQIIQTLTSDLSAYGQLAQGIVPQGGVTAYGFSTDATAPLTNAQMQAAAWLQSAATQAQELLQGYFTDISNAFAAAENLGSDIIGLHFDHLISADGQSGDLQVLILSLEKLISDVQGLTGALGADGGAAPPGPQSAAGAVMKYFGPVLRPIQSALDAINGFLSAADGVLQQLMTDLTALAQGLDMAKNLAVEFKWTPKICGLECLGALAFVPSTDQALNLDIKVNANSNNGPTGLDLTCRLDSFAICFGDIQGVTSTSGCGTIQGPPTGPTFMQSVQDADVSLVFDHIQVQMLAGQKPDVDCVFSDIYFGGDLAFVETIKNLIPMDSFSDPPFVNVTSSGITAGFTLGIPNIALGMFSIDNINISAALTIPWVSTSGVNGITFEFDFCTIDNPFIVTVSMLGGGGFFGMTMDMSGLTRIQLGIQVCAQLAIDLVVASGSVSIEAGIFLVYIVPPNASGTDPVTGEAEVNGWIIGGYLRLRGELDVCGIITISVELYLQITYAPSTGKCVASGFISVDVSLFFFSMHAEVEFSRTFAGSNGDPTLAQMMSPGGLDPMVDPALGLPATWNPFAEYCMAYAQPSWIPNP